MSEVVGNIGKTNPVHPGKTRLRHPDPVASHFVADGILHFPGPQFCEMRGVLDLGLSSGHPEVDGAFCSSPKDDRVKPGHFELGTEKTGCLRLARGPGEWGFPNSRKSTARG